MSISPAVPGVLLLAAAEDSPIKDILLYVAVGGILLWWVIDKALSILKKRGIDPANTAVAIGAMADSVTLMLTRIEEQDKRSKKAADQTQALYDVHLGDKATDRDGRPKWWNREEVEEAIININKVLPEMSSMLRGTRKEQIETRKVLHQYHTALVQMAATINAGSGIRPAIDIPPPASESMMPDRGTPPGP